MSKESLLKSHLERRFKIINESNNSDFFVNLAEYTKFIFDSPMLRSFTKELESDPKEVSFFDKFEKEEKWKTLLESWRRLHFIFLCHFKDLRYDPFYNPNPTGIFNGLSIGFFGKDLKDVIASKTSKIKYEHPEIKKGRYLFHCKKVHLFLLEKLEHSEAFREKNQDNNHRENFYIKPHIEKGDIKFGDGFHITPEGRIYKNGRLATYINENGKEAKGLAQKNGYYLIGLLKKTGGGKSHGRDYFKQKNKNWKTIRKVKSIITKCCGDVIDEAEGKYRWADKNKS